MATKTPPIYKSNAKIFAFKIATVTDNDDGALLTPAEFGYDPIQVDDDYVDDFAPAAGNYYTKDDASVEGYMEEADFLAAYTLIG
jgi:hypothetical protein